MKIQGLDVIDYESEAEEMGVSEVYAAPSRLRTLLFVPSYIVLSEVTMWP